jgi:hypothetical protein
MPLTLTDELTGKVWNFATPPQTPESDGVTIYPFFMFVGLPFTPGFYVLSNTGATVAQIVLFGQTFNVPAGARWRFMAHENLEAYQLPWAGTGAVGKQFPYGGANIPSTGL